MLHPLDPPSFPKPCAVWLPRTGPGSAQGASGPLQEGPGRSGQGSRALCSTARRPPHLEKRAEPAAEGLRLHFQSPLKCTAWLRRC